MSTKNDEIFANFMVRLARKIADRHDESLALAKQNSDKFNQMIAAYTQHGNPAVIYSGILQYPADYTGQFNPLTVDELAVIQAYFKGEDVLMTILSQER